MLVIVNEKAVLSRESVGTLILCLCTTNFAATSAFLQLITHETYHLTLHCLRCRWCEVNNKFIKCKVCRTEYVQ